MQRSSQPITHEGPNAIQMLEIAQMEFLWQVSRGQDRQYELTKDIEATIECVNSSVSLQSKPKQKKQYDLIINSAPVYCATVKVENSIPL